MRIAQLTMCACIITLSVDKAGAQMYLRHLASRMIYGPFDEPVGTRYVLPEGTYASVSPTASEIGVTKVLRETLVAEALFEETNVAAVLSFCASQCSASNALVFRMETNGYVVLPGIPALCAIGEEGRDTVPLVSIAARHISLFELLEIVSKQTFLPINIAGRTITLSQKGEPIILWPLSFPKGKPAGQPSR